MLRIIALITKFILVALTALLFGSCNHSINLNAIEGSGNVTTENRVVEGKFESVEVSDAIDVIIEQAERSEISVKADDNLQKHIITKVENGILFISCDKNSFINTRTKKVTVKMPKISQLEATSGATITSKNTLKGQNIKLNSSSAALIDVGIEADNITCDTSSGSNITVNGKALKIGTTASSGGLIDAKNLLANEVTANVASGGSISVHPIVSLKAEASSGGSINYDIIPKSIQKKISSGGSIGKE